MARHLFFGDLSGWAMGIGADETALSGAAGKHALLIPGGTVTLWDAAAGGNQYIDLLDMLGNPITQVTADSSTGQFPQIQGPDTTPDTWYMWADGNGGAGPRVRVVAGDLADAMGSVADDHDSLAGLLAFFRTGATGQMLSPDPDQASTFGIRWLAPPSAGAGGGSSPAGYIGVDVTQSPYGADATGATDSRAVIQQAIDNVSALGGGIVQIPPGRFAIGYPGLQYKPDVWIRGAGQEATILQATGTWSSEAGVLNVGTLSTPANVWRAQASDLMIRGTAGTGFAASPPSNISGIVLNTGGVTWDSDSVHRFENILIWDVDRGMIVYGVDDQAANFKAIRIRHTLRQGVLIGHEDGSGGGADCNFLYLDVSSGNRQTNGTYAGIEVYGTNNTFIGCGSWFHKRSTAFVSSQDYKDGSGWFIAGTRNRFVACQAQDNGGRGFSIKLGKNLFTACIADSNNYLDNLTSPAGQYECSGFYVGASASDLILANCEAYNRSSYSQLQRYGFLIDAATRNVQVTGTAWDNKSSAAAADPLDGVAWVNGAAHTSHEVKVLSAFGSTRTTISNGGTSGTAGKVEKRKGAGDETTVTGTTLVSDNVLAISVPGGARYYKLDGMLIYRGDATDNLKFGLETSVVAGSGTVDCHWQPAFTAPDGTAQHPYVLSQVGTTRTVVADGDGGVTGSGYTNQRSIKIDGFVYVGTSVTTGKVTVKVAANGTAGNTGVRVKENSTLTLTPFNPS